jgi:hypothetical protein
MTLSFNLALDMGSVALEEIPGIVKHVSSVGGLNTFGIEFDQSAKLMNKPKIQEELARIEQLLQKHEEIVNRINR